MAIDRKTTADVAYSNFGIVVCVIILTTLVATAACKKRASSNLEGANSDKLSYSFGGACGTRGYWTQTAVSRAAEISAAIEKLRDNPKCSKLYDSMKELAAIQKNFTPSDESGFRYSRSMTLTREISSIASYLNLTDFRRGDGLALLLDRTIEQRTLQADSLAEAQAVSSVTMDSNGQLKIARSVADSLEERIATSGRAGLDSLQRYIQAVNDSAECLNDNPASAGSLVTQTAQIMGAFASADPATAGGIGQALNSFSKLLRDSKYNAAIRKANEAAFADSIGCMIESLQYADCGARDAQAILTSGGNRLEQQIGRGAIDKNSPFYGYFLMSYHLPVVARWLSQLMSSYVPRQKMEATRANTIFRIPVDVEAYRIQLNATYEQKMRDFLQTTDRSARARLLLNLVVSLQSKLSHAVFPRPNVVKIKRPMDPNKQNNEENENPANIPNFFTITTKDTPLAFRLIGIPADKIPAICVAGTEEAKDHPLNFFQWANSTKEGLQPNFFNFETSKETNADGSTSTSLSLPAIIKNQLDGVVKEAQTAAMDFFWKNAPLDLDAIASDAGLGQMSTAISSLRIVKDFLVDQLVASKTNRTIEGDTNLRSLMDVISRIDMVDKAYQQYSESGESQTAAVRFVATVYEKFGLVFYGNTFLQQRIVGIIKRDIFNKIAKQKLGTTALESEILLAGGDLAFDEIVKSMGGDAVGGKTQLAAARSLNAASLTAIEAAFGDKFKSVISYYRNIATGRGDTSSASIRNDSYLRSLKDSAILPRSNSDTFVDRFYNYAADQFEFVGVRSFIKRSWHPDLYPMPAPWRGPGYGDTEAGNIGTYWATLCALALALPNPDKYADLCYDAVLKSPYETAGNASSSGIGPLSMSFKEWRKSFETSTGDAAVMRSAQCAYYDISRRNQIYSMTLDHFEAGDNGIFVPLPSNSGQLERVFYLDDFIGDAAKNIQFVRSIVARKIGKVPANATYCSSYGQVAPQICSEYEQRRAKRGSANHGAVALSCYDLKAQAFYCCSGSLASGQMPDSSDAPCYRSLTDNSELVPTLTEKDL